MGQKYHLTTLVGLPAETNPIIVSSNAMPWQTCPISAPKVPVMNRLLASPRTLPFLLVLLACGLMLASGTIRQPPDYDRFAGQSTFLGIPHSGDVLSNLGFALVGLWEIGRAHV